MARHCRAAALLAGLLVVTACTADPAPPTSTTADSDTARSSATTVSSPPTSPRPDFDADLKDELVHMMALDQAVRGGPVPAGVDPDEVSDIDRVDRDNQTRLAEIFAEHRWPGWDLVGKRGSSAAWTIVQHADLNPGFQQQGLDLLTAAVEAGNASPGDLAYLTDRVLVGQGRPQVYGTQWEVDDSDQWVPRTPIKDRAGVDKRRTQMGLTPLADYLDELEAMAP